MADEKVYFEENSVKVTNSRLLIGEQTFAMDEIRAVSTYWARKNRPIAFILIGVGAGLTGTGRGLSSFLQIVINILTVGSIIAGIVILVRFSTIYGLTLSTESGENSISFSSNKKFIEKIKEAINQSIAER